MSEVIEILSSEEEHQSTSDGFLTSLSDMLHDKLG
jgi:hypothetical protein